MRVDKEYLFDTARGEKTLADLFNGRSQLLVYHFMFGPDWKEGCKNCSFFADHVDGLLVHLEQNDLSMVMISRAPLAKINAFKKRMGWKFTWVSSNKNDFNFDYHVSFTREDLKKGVYYNYAIQKIGIEDLPGFSVFYKDENGNVFHTYSCYGSGGDLLVGANNFFDLTPKGRNGSSQADWVRHHDKYDTP